MKMSRKKSYFFKFTLLISLLFLAFNNDVQAADFGQRELTVGEKWDLGNGYSIMANSIDAKATPKLVWLKLSDRGNTIDDRVLSEGETYNYKNIFKTTVSSIRAGPTNDILILTNTYTERPSSSGRIQVYSIPSNANIYLDGNFQGTTTKTIMDVAAGSHTITVKFWDYQDWSREISVIAGETLTVSADLIPVVYVAVTTSPPEPTPTPYLVATTIQPAPTASPKDDTISPYFYIILILVIVFVLLFYAKRKEPSKQDQMKNEEINIDIEKRVPYITINRILGKTSIKEGDEFGVTIELTNEGKSVARSVSFSDKFNDGFKILSGENSWTGELEDGDSKHFQYKVKADRPGRYTIPELTVQYRDGQGKIYEKITEPVEIEVIPEEKGIPGAVPIPINAYGVIIGIGKYKDPDIPTLRYAVNDALEIYNILTDTQYGNFPKENVKLLLDEQATLTEIKSAMGTFLARKAGKDDTVCMYFAGHGSPEIDPTGKADDRLEKFIVPYDAKKDDLFSYGLSMDEIRNIYKRIESKRVVFFLDCCYSGEAGGRTFSRPDIGARNITISDKFLEDLSGEGRLIITASKPDELSLETTELEHGIFTYYLAEGLRGKGDLNKDGVVTADELYSYVYEQVTKKARLMGASQHPLKKGMIIGEIPLTRYETESMRNVKDLHSIAARLVKECKYEEALKKYEEILNIDEGNSQASRCIEKLRKIIEEISIKKKLSRLSDLYYEGKLTPPQYELARRLMKLNFGDLNKEDKKALKLVNDLISDQISISTFQELIEFPNSAK